MTGTKRSDSTFRGPGIKIQVTREVGNGASGFHTRTTNCRATPSEMNHARVEARCWRLQSQKSLPLSETSPHSGSSGCHDLHREAVLQEREER